jgi:hypothetical protein
MEFILAFHARGERYTPSKIPFAFAKQHDVGDTASTGRFKGQPYPYGSSEIRVPDDLVWAEKIPKLVETVTPLLPQMKKEGADSFYISAGYFYDGQCNLEFSPEELRLLASLECPFCPSCYHGETEPNKESEINTS